MESNGQFAMYGYYYIDEERQIMQYMLDERGNMTEMREFSQLEHAIRDANVWDACTIQKRHQRADGGWVVTVYNHETLEYYLVTLDANGVATHESNRFPIYENESTDRDIGFVLRERMIVIDDTYTVLYNEYTGSKFYIFDEALGLHGPFETASMVTDGYRASDGTVILTCEDTSALSYDPSADRVKPIKLYADTAVSEKAEQIYYRDGAVYFFCDDGVYLQRDRTETYLFDWASSYLNPKNITVYEFLADDSFLIWYKDPLTGVVAPAVLQKADAMSPTALASRTPVRVLSLFCEEAESAYITASIDRFNMGNADYFIEHTDYDALYPETGYDVMEHRKQKEQLLKEDALNGMPYDVILMGSTYYWQTTIRSYAEKGLLADLSAFAEEVSFVESVAASLVSKQGITALPVSVEYFGLIANASVVPYDTEFTLETLYAMTDALTEGEALLDGNSTFSFRQVAQYDFIDWETETCHFDCDAFVRLLEFSRLRGTTAGGGKLFGSRDSSFSMLNRGMQILNDPLTPFKAGALKLIPVQFADFQTFSMVYYLTEKLGIDINVLGYPTSTGNALKMQPKVQAVMLDHSRHKEAVYDYFRILFSEEVQSSVAFREVGLPVITSAWDNYAGGGYYYFLDLRYVTSNGTPAMQVRLMDSSETQDPSMAQYTEIYAPEELCSRIKERILSSAVRGMGDPVITEIIDDERVSFTSGIITAEEAAKHIQSRVSIYLAE